MGVEVDTVLARMVCRAHFLAMLMCPATMLVACHDDGTKVAAPHDPADGDAAPRDSEEIAAAAPACNGYTHLCLRRLDEVSFVRTHNGHAALEEGFHPIAANHRYGIRRQLEDGVRSVNIDVYFEDESLQLCHGLCQLGSTPLDTALGWIRDFLDAHPRDVLLLDLQNKAPVPEVAAAFEEAGLLDFVHEQVFGAAWPTLGELIDSGGRLVVFSGDDEGPGWLHNENDFIFNTHWGTETVEDLDCELAKPEIPHGLFELNHNLTDPVASEELAEQVNWDPLLSERVAACADEVGHRVNLLSVDFYSIGDVLTVVERLNSDPAAPL